MPSWDTSANQLSFGKMKSRYQVLIGRRIIVFFLHIGDTKGRPAEISLLNFAPVAVIQLLYVF